MILPENNTERKIWGGDKKCVSVGSVNRQVFTLLISDLFY